ncbi:GSCOCT00014259001.2-RA-CDS [Cotesia congregata]|uniref:Uncharacterized protein n=2 Tax=root TaxID=1 RepID=S6CVM2_COTCN|nr:unknown protein [Bracoviriform congregatae]CAD6243411.1 GSCOCT00014259001.2-RA-CDS [Cotesia congregata]CAG17425.1 unknown protein [Bracoviriform congregatae]CCQ71121.1 hypothetical protein BV5-2 [Cotesia congregata]
MHHGKTSIFLFFLIIGTSVFPNGSSTGLASAKPMGPLIMAGITVGAEILQNVMKPQAAQRAPKIIYGAETNNKNNAIDNKNVQGSLSFGSNTQQQNNYFGKRRSGSYDQNNYY